MTDKVVKSTTIALVRFDLTLGETAGEPAGEFLVVTVEAKPLVLATV